MCDACRREWTKYVEMRDDVGTKPRTVGNGSENATHAKHDAPVPRAKKAHDRAHDPKVQHLREAVALLAESSADPAAEQREGSPSDVRGSAVPVTTTGENGDATVATEFPERTPANGPDATAPPEPARPSGSASTTDTPGPSAPEHDAPRESGPEAPSLPDASSEHATHPSPPGSSEPARNMGAGISTFEQENVEEGPVLGPTDAPASDTMFMEDGHAATREVTRVEETGTETPQMSARERRRRARADRKANRREEKKRDRAASEDAAATPVPEEPEPEPIAPLVEFDDAATEGDAEDPFQIPVEVKPARRFLCPRCESPNLAADLSDDVGVARCERCKYVATDLLALVPVKPVGLLELTLGTGMQAVLRAAGFLLVCTALLALVFAGR